MSVAAERSEVILDALPVGECVGIAFSGGLDTSCAIAWLKEDYGFDEVIAVLVDVGQDTDFEPAFARGRAAGADDVVLVDRPGRGYGDDYSPWLVDAPVGELVHVRAAAVEEEGILAA